jgi:RNA polymerase sigma-70 factor (sigma-E family)
VDDSFDDFVVNRGPALLRFAYLLTGDLHRAEDLVQEVLARVHQRWSRIERAEGAEFYVRTALVRQNISWWRRRSARSERPVAEVPDGTVVDDGEQVLAARDEMWALLATLPRRQRAVLVLRF